MCVCVCVCVCVCSLTKLPKTNQCPYKESAIEKHGRKEEEEEEVEEEEEEGGGLEGRGQGGNLCTMSWLLVVPQTRRTLSCPLCWW